MRYHQFHAMTTTILAGARGDPSRVQAGFHQVEALVHALEKRFTRFEEESELCDLNRAGGDWFLASLELYEVVHLAYQAYFDTGGLFNPAVLAALEYAGYDHSLEENPAFKPGVRRLNQGASVKPGIRRLEQSAIVVPDFGATRFDPQRKAIRLPSGLRIDLGGIAKGWIAEQAAHLLRQYSDACVVDAGGDLFAIGSPAEGEPWLVGLEDPFDSSRDITVLTLPPGAAATSATTHRRWLQAGQERHHIINPRTGLPVEAFWVSVTVIAPHTAQAEVLAKALLIAGPSGAPSLLSRHPQAAYIAIDEHGQVWGSPNSHEVLDAKPQSA